MSRILTKIKFFFYCFMLKKISSKNSSDSLVVKFRVWLLKEKFRYCGTNVNIQHYVEFRSAENIYIGNNSGVGIGSIIYADKRVKIGNDVIIGPQLILLTANHKVDENYLYRSSGYDYKEVIIGDNVWIGARCTILPGSIIPSGAIIAAGSVVTGELPFKNHLYAGVPAEPKKKLYE